jgi:sensor histidine kinase YesM
MNGTIFLEWSEPEKGTCFSFRLPKASGKPVNIETLEMTQEVAVTVEKAESELVQLKLNIGASVGESTSFAAKCSIGKAARRYSPLETIVTGVEIGTPTYRSGSLGIDKLMQSFKVLAVDDEATNLRVLKSLLIGDGYQVLTASSGIEALEIIKDQQDIDLVLMDVMMPRMSGYEACRKIRADYSLYDLPLLILTVRNTSEDIAVGFEAGANDFVTKPFVAKELRSRVATLLLLKKSVQEALKNEMAFLQAQIKPHFLYNALSTIMSYCYTDGARAGDLLANLSEYLQKSFNIDNSATTVSLENELELTKAYTEIEKARFGERLIVEYDVDESLMEQRILPLTIQPLVENAIRHGLMKRKNGGRVRIVVQREVDKIGITVEDNGIGIEDLEAVFQRKDSLKQKGGIGLTNIKRRLMKYYGAELYLASNANEGTKVYFAIPDQGIR